MPNKYSLKSLVQACFSPRHLYAAANNSITARTKAYLANPNRRTMKIDHWLKSLTPLQGSLVCASYELSTKPFHAYMYYQYGVKWAAAHSVIHIARWPIRIYLAYCLHHNYTQMRTYRKVCASIRKFKIKAKIRTKNSIRHTTQRLRNLSR